MHVIESKPKIEYSVTIAHEDFVTKLKGVRGFYVSEGDLLIEHGEHDGQFALVAAFAQGAWRSVVLEVVENA